MMTRMDSPMFGVQATVAGGALPEEWQALLASQASTLAALLSRMQTTAATHTPCQPVCQAHVAWLEASMTTTLFKKSLLQQRAEHAVERFIQTARKPVVIEFSGVPKAGKTTTLNQIQSFLKRCGFRV